MISFDDRSEFRRTVAAYNEQLMQLYRRQTPAAPIPEETPPPQPATPSEEDPAEEDFPLPSETVSEVQAAPPAPGNGREMSTGYLQFFATTAGQSEPVPRAHITVTRDGTLVATAFTDISGLSPVLSLPAVDGRYTLSPGNDAPYTIYAATVSADGYYTQLFTALELYGGTVALQPVVLVPLPVGTAAGSTDVNGQPPDL